MSDIIRLLPDHIANQIAAGEVIQRPASVVKELVENAIDANATQIDVIIKDAGKTLIQVIDNGKGMSEMDARMAFERHATSKVQVATDLFALQTKGFRGEALASIAAIAHVELKTRQTESEFGTSVRIEGSTVVEQAPATCKIGSSFEIKNLFFNVPARRNFLKSDIVEFKHIEEEFLRVALAHPSIQFTLHNNNSICFHLPQANVRKRIVDIFGRSYNDKLVPLEEETNIVKLTGFIGKPEFAKKTRGEQYFFVNNRYFKDSFFHHAITQAFEGLLAPKTFPSYFLFFEVNPASIDVNVHPTKTEIKFEDDREIYAILKSAVRQALGKFNIAPSLDFEQETSFEIPHEMRSQMPVEPVIKVDPTYNPFQTSTRTSGAGITLGQSPALKSAGFGGLQANRGEWENFYEIKEEETQSSTAIFTTENDAFEPIHFFLLQGNLLLCQQRSGLLMIHAKRAIERVTYDEIMRLFMIQPIHSQQLLFPIVQEIVPFEKHFWEENQVTLERLGFSWNVTGNALEILAAPAHLKEDGIAYTIEKLRGNLQNSPMEKGDVAHEMILSIATSVARQQKTWNLEAVNALMDSLFSCEDHSYSPAGKKILQLLSNQELEQKF